ncbi:MAG: DUF2807 domain-containing protein [Sphingomonas sp. 28-62-20]|uniref:head GIN domain-containing protein n=1 Tax=Sphingomonas sp. 28-62-20 TaxID=1970433 RepID=UPI000BCA4DAD|nr:MAG: DUF2807 domain-containing protein [Sphingomonas sp. 28-62-20]
MIKAVVIAMMPLAGCSVAVGDGGIKGTGSGNSRSFAVADFTGVELAGSDDVEIKVGGAFSVRAQGPSAVLDRLKIERDGDTLEIGRKSMTGWHWGDRKGATIYVTMPRIAAARIAGSGDLSIDRADGDAFKGDTAGSGGLTIGALNVRSATLSIAGSGDISAKGMATKLDLSIAGSGDIDARSVKATEARVSIAGSGSVAADVTGPAKVSIVGSGDADLGPNATCSTSRIGSGTVRCGK